MTLRSVMLLAVLWPLIRPADAQLIPVKTIPIADGDQYGFFPSANLGIGGVSIALADSLRDPFLNPAKGSRIRRGQFFGSPSFYSLSKNAGSGSTLPLGALVRAGSSFGALAIAIQELKTDVAGGGVFAEPLALSSIPIDGSVPKRDHKTNRYAFAMAGHSFAAARLSFAGSVLWSGLHAMDGVDVLYPRSISVGELGGAVDLRFGMLKEWGSAAGTRALEAVVVHERYAMSHHVQYQDFFWDPGTRQPIPQLRSEDNFDRTHTTGLQLKYERPLADSGWRVGALLTGNRTTQPTIPRLGSMNVLGNPGQSSAYNAGLGVSKSKGPVTFGVDAIYEPIWSRASDNGPADPGRYRFANVILRTGASRDFEIVPGGSSLRLQLGVQLRSIGYRLDHNEAASSVTREDWNEWTHSWGLAFRSRDLEMRYLWRMQSGAGRPGLSFGGGFDGPVIATSSFAPPTPSFVMVPVRVTTHQLSISVPIL